VTPSKVKTAESRTPSKYRGDGDGDDALDKARAEARARAEAKAKQRADAKGRKKEADVKVSLGPIGQLMDLALNASREKELEFTVLDRIQARLIPQLAVINTEWEYCVEVALFREDADNYRRLYPDKDRPEPPNPISDFIHLTAQCQKSFNGKNLQSAIDLTLADIETRSNEEEPFGHDHGFEED